MSDVFRKNRKISDECLGAFIDEGFNQSETARACGCSRQAINQRIHYKNPPSHKYKKLLNEILVLLNKGKTQTEIAKLLGLNRHYLSVFIKKNIKITYSLK